MWVAYSTTTDIADPSSWTRAAPILDGGSDDPRPEGGLDYWIICDDARAYLFFTSLNGKLWRAWTKLADFPQGTHEYPDRSATLLIQVPQVSAGGHVALRGPGIESTVDVTVAGMGAGFWRELMRDRDGFPIGVDVVFISPDAICACPRSTTVMLRETA